MVQVRLAREWTDGQGAAHAAGDMVDVDAVMLAELEANGVVATTDMPPTGKSPSDLKAPKPNWAGMTGVEI